MSPIPQSRAPDADLPRTAGGFQLLRELGRGGMGIVYEARELASGRTVALKVLAAELRVSDEAFERFRREARLAAAISDHHCVFVYGAHEVEGAPAIAMELCPGETLDQKLASREAIAIQTAVRWTLEILTGLEAAHERGIVHRDVKPSNCFTTADGRAKIGDFGLSRTLEGDIQLTQSGAFLGSPLYSSPEQIRGREVDLRSDLYSCGATLYALLTGRAPHSGSNVGEVLARILSEDPPSPRALRPEIPRELERVVLHSMERDPKRRFQDHASFRDALQPFMAADVAPARPIRRFVAHWIDYVTWLLLKACVGLGATWAGLNVIEPDPVRPWMPNSIGLAAVVACVPWLMATVFEGWFGAGPGKWLLGLRVVAIDTLRPSFARAALRAGMFYGPRLILQFVAMSMEWNQAISDGVTDGGTILIALAMLTTMRKTNGYRAVYELASGTRVIHKRSPFGALRLTAPPPSTTLEPAMGIPSSVGAYEIRGVVGVSPDGVVLSARDASLDRSVWIHARRTSSGAPDAARRALARGGRLRWLDSLSAEGANYEVFESPGGISLVDGAVAAIRVPWPTAQRFLRALADELAATQVRGDVAIRFDVAQVWIDRMWHPRLLDFPIGSQNGATTSALELLTEAAKRLLLQSGDPRLEFPKDLPAHAELVVARLLRRSQPFRNIDEARHALADINDRPSEITRATRAAQLTVGAVPSALYAILSIVAALWLLPFGGQVIQVTGYVNELAEQARVDDAGGGAHSPLSSDERKARAILISNSQSNPFGQAALRRSLDESHRAIVTGSSAQYPQPTSADVEWARDICAARPAARGIATVEQGKAIAQGMLILMPPGAVLLWGVFGTISAFLFDGGMTLMLFGVRVRSRRGKLASRWRCAWRCLIAWLPFAFAYAAGAYLTSRGEAAAGWTVTALTALVHGAAIAFCFARPTAGLQDRLAGTTLVVR